MKLPVGTITEQNEYDLLKINNESYYMQNKNAFERTKSNNTYINCNDSFTNFYYDLSTNMFLTLLITLIKPEASTSLTFDVLKKTIDGNHSTENLWYNDISIIQTRASVVSVCDFINKSTERYGKTDFEEVAILEETCRDNDKQRLYVFKSDRRNKHAFITNEITWSLVRKILVLYPILFPEKFMLSEMSDDFKQKFETMCQTYTKMPVSDLTWFTQIDELLKMTNYIENITKKQIERVLSSSKRNQISVCQRNLKQNQENMNLAENDYRNYCRKMMTLEATLAGLNAMKSDTEQLATVFEYVNANKAIQTISAYDDSTLKIEVKTPLYYYEPKELEMYYKRDRLLYELSDTCIPELFKEIFIDKKYLLWVQQACYINTYRSEVSKANSDLPITYMPNPHIRDYNCWGTNKTSIIKAITEGEIVGAMEQIVAAIRNLNFTDSTVVQAFIKYFNKGSGYDLLKTIQNVETNEFLSVEDYRIMWKAEQDANGIENTEDKKKLDF